MGAYALLLGISEFTDPRLAKLNAPKGDVEALAGVLKDPERGAFDSVITCIDQDVQAIRDQLVALLDQRAPDDMVLLYYSGHGIVTKGQRLFLATGQTNFDRPQARSLSALEMRDMLEQSRAGKQVVILDCCHSGVFVDGAKGVVQTVTDDTFACDSAEGQYVLTATDALQFAYDATGAAKDSAPQQALSRFTGWLVDAIGKGEADPRNERITLDAVFDYLSRRARIEAAGMTPRRFVKRNSGEMVIARNPNAAPEKLPDALLAQLDAKEWQARRDAVLQLGKIDQAHLREAVEQAIADRLSAERDVEVRDAMLKLLRRTGSQPPDVKPAGSSVPVQIEKPKDAEEKEPRWRDPKWLAVAAAVVLAVLGASYAFFARDPAAVTSETVNAAPANAAVERLRAELRARILALTPEEALRIAREMEPNLAARALAVRNHVQGVDPATLRLTEGLVARFVLENWVLNDDASPASIKQWTDILARTDSARVETAKRLAGEAEAARQREADAVKERDAEAARQREAGANFVSAIQSLLREKGFYAGALDGNLGAGTRAAILAFQKSANLPATGTADDATFAKLRAAPTPPPPPRTAASLNVPSARTAEPARSGAEQAAQNPGTEFKDCAECPAMISVPAGGFTMGSATSEPGRGRDESPQHRITFDRSFAVGKYEVTFAEWDACVAGGGCNNYRPADEGWGRGTHPVVNISWNDAQAYVAWLRNKTRKPYRLLSEAEWEYAARGQTVSAFYWGARATVNFAKFDSSGTAPAGSYVPNSFGLYDMLGNVNEWAMDCVNNSYGGAPADGKAWLTGDCDLRAIRGGAWNSGPANLRAANRDWDATGFRVNRNGFRVGRGL